MITTLLVDMDGVVVDFVKAACAAMFLGIDYDKVIEDWDPDHFGLEHQIGISADDMWGAVDAAGEVFWEFMPEYPWTEDLLYWLDASGLKWYFCTTPSRNAASAAGKLKWMQRYRGPKFRNWVLTPHKHLLANPRTLLIDDNQSGVKKFRAAGGHAVLFPQPWNERGHIAFPWNLVRAEVSQRVFPQVPIVPPSGPRC